MTDRNKRTIFLVSATEPAIDRLGKTCRPDKVCSWVYLGVSVAGSRKIERELGNKFHRLFIGDLLQKKAQAAREDYIDYTARLLSSTGSPIWFLSSLSERNPFVTRFLLHYSYLEVGKELASQSGCEDLVLFCEADSVLDTLAHILSQDTDRVVVISHGTGLFTSQLYRKAVKTIKKGWFFTRFALRIAGARLFRLLKGPITQHGITDRYVILHSWTDSRAFPAPGRFANPYFGEIGPALEKEWPAFIYLADILPSYWYPRAMFHLLKAKRNICLMEEFISLNDLFRALSTAAAEYPVPTDIPLFRNLDVSGIVLDEIERDRSDTRVEQTILNSCIARRLCRQYPVGLFIYAFEHHTWEKMFCSAIKEGKFPTALAAYAIVFVNRMYTCYSLSSYEKATAPLPDVIFVSGEQGKSMLASSGFDDNLIRVGGAVRYPNFLSGTVTQRNRSARAGKILLALSGEINTSLELVLKAMEAFTPLSGTQITIKCHPTIPYSVLSRYLPPLPEGFSVTDRSIAQLLPESDLVLYTESTVCVEAVAAGVPVLHVRSDHSIDINIFEDDPSVPSCADPADIRKRSEIILQGGQVLPSSDLVKQLFLPADTEAIVSQLVQQIRRK
ncbi:MAG: hypothetical protein A4E35_02165 [Methanoregula sp. PtaU1.Bin051]|nr:MAG: hypothetical protein A4E35_02165 [Methanoregula sp. PtaU1.Bin051]